MKWLPILLLSCVCSFADRLNTLYYQNFESGVIPVNWEEWSVSLNSTNSWRYGAAPLAGTNSIQFNNYGAQVDLGAFYDWKSISLDDIYVQFKFKTSGYPPIGIIEIIDLYDDYSHEVCNIYLQTTGQLILFLGFNSVIMTDPIPTNTVVNIWLHYVNSVPSYGTAAWSTNSVEPTSGGQYASLGQGYYRTPIGRLLFGPVSQGLTFYYDDLYIKMPMQSPANLVVRGQNRVSGNVVFR